MIEDIEKQLNDMNYNQLLSFGYLLTKKLFPDYAFFAEYEDFGRPDYLYSGLVALRKRISGVSNDYLIDKLISDLWEDEDITPDTDDYPGNLAASLALNSVSAMFHTLKYAKSKDKNDIKTVANISLESVVMFFVVNNNINQNMPKHKYEEILNKSVFIQSEIRVQMNIIDKIKAISNTSKRFYTKIRTNDNKLVENSLYSQFVYA